MRFFITILLLAFSFSVGADIPAVSWKYQKLIKIANKKYHRSFDYLSASAAQIHQESYWNKNAKSWAGAMGLAQFMPATAKGESKRCGLGLPSPYRPVWSILAQSCHMAYLYKRNYEFIDGCERYAAALSGYNGGQGNVNKQRRKWARETWMNAQEGVYWFGAVENWRIRGKSAHKENRHYPRRILFELTPKYLAAGYGGKTLCEV